MVVRTTQYDLPGQTVPRKEGSRVSRAEDRAARCAALLPLLFAQSPWNRLQPEQQARLVGSLILLTIGAVAVVVLAWLALRVGRRSSQREDLKMELFRQKIKAEDWASKPLVPPDDKPRGSGREDADQ
jgi:hypothetical protein